MVFTAEEARLFESKCDNHRDPRDHDDYVKVVLLDVYDKIKKAILVGEGHIHLMLAPSTLYNKNKVFQDVRSKLESIGYRVTPIGFIYWNDKTK